MIIEALVCLGTLCSACDTAVVSTQLRGELVCIYVHAECVCVCEGEGLLCNLLQCVRSGEGGAVCVCV